MARILILGAGLAGLGAAMLRGPGGHEVTVLERDPAAPPPPEHADAAWDGWPRRGVNQFRLPHFMMPRWWSLMREELPEVRCPAGSRRRAAPEHDRGAAGRAARPDA